MKKQVQHVSPVSRARLRYNAIKAADVTVPRASPALAPSGPAMFSNATVCNPNTAILNMGDLIPVAQIMSVTMSKAV